MIEGGRTYIEREKAWNNLQGERTMLLLHELRTLAPSSSTASGSGGERLAASVL